MFPYFTSAKCYWLDDYYGKDSNGIDQNYALIKIDEMFAKVYGLDQTETCDIVPVVKISKDKLISNEE